MASVAHRPPPPPPPRAKAGARPAQTVPGKDGAPEWTTAPAASGSAMPAPEEAAAQNASKPAAAEGSASAGGGPLDFRQELERALLRRTSGVPSTSAAVTPPADPEDVASGEPAEQLVPAAAASYDVAAPPKLEPETRAEVAPPDAIPTAVAATAPASDTLQAPRATLSSPSSPSAALAVAIAPVRGGGSGVSTPRSLSTLGGAFSEVGYGGAVGAGSRTPRDDGHRLFAPLLGSGAALSSSSVGSTWGRKNLESELAHTRGELREARGHAAKLEEELRRVQVENAKLRHQVDIHKDRDDLLRDIRDRVSEADNSFGVASSSCAGGSGTGSVRSQGVGRRKTVCSTVCSMFGRQ